MNLYRRFELRENPTTLLQFEKAPASYLQTMFGGVASSIRIPVRGESGGNLVSCENFKNAGKVMDVPGVINSQTAGGPAIGLSPPYQWEEIYDGLTADILDMPVCSHEGAPVPLRAIQPTKYAEGSYTLSYEYFNPIFLLDKGSGAMGRTADSKYDSITTGTWRSNTFVYPDTTEALSPDKTPSNIVLPQDINHLSSVVAASTAATKGVYISGGALTDSLTVPYKDDYNYKAGKVIWDWGANAKALCSKPAYGAATIDNEFKAIDGDQRKEDSTPTTQIYYTPIALLRDSLLKNAGNERGFPFVSRDAVDSYLSTFEAGDDKIALDASNWWGAWQSFFGIPGHVPQGSAPTKSFYQREDLGTARTYSIPLDYPLNEKTFPELFPEGDLATNPTGTGGTGESGLYPWVSTDCAVWGNQYKDDPNKIAVCNADPHCLRTCRLVPFTDACTNEYYTVSCDFRPEYGSCVCTRSGVQNGSCSPEQNFECVIQGKNGWVGPSPSSPDVPGDPGNPYDLEACLRDDGTFGDTEYSGESGDTNKDHLTCDVQQAGPYTGTIDLGDAGGGGMMRSFHSMQEPVNGQPKGDQTPIDPIISSANLLVQTWASPYAGIKSYEGLGCIDYENTKNAEIGVKRMWCKDTPRVGDSGASSALLAIAAGPVFSDSGPMGYNPLAPSRNLFAGPVYPAFAAEDCNPEDEPDGICDLAPSKPAQPLPDPVTMEMLESRTISACAVTYCDFNGDDPVPSTLKQILSAAGSDWSVPAEAILSFMVAEGYFAKEPGLGEYLMYDWTEPNILAWSLPVEGTIVKKDFRSTCDDLNWGEQGTPSMFISAWDDANQSPCLSWGDSSLKCGIEKLVTGRGQYARRCNLLDSAYGLAKMAATAVGNVVACGSWGDAEWAAALGSFTGNDPMARPGSGYYNSMANVRTACQ
jgi:hypothetical protein